MPPKRSGRTFDPYRAVLLPLARVGQLGLLVAGGALAGYALGYGLDALAGSRGGRVAGLVLGLGGGLLAAGRQVLRELNHRGDRSA
ncbi:MAG: AtpZ/AtpI family protein [Candidatus Bipolaricaulota bacterium]|nr:AtpZ/AtpI family protein [Candidatus Bipolaricaulota bacterium]